MHLVGSGIALAALEILAALAEFMVHRVPAASTPRVWTTLSLPQLWLREAEHTRRSVLMAGGVAAGGPLGWLYPFEIQPLETRPAGGAVASLMNLLFSFVIGQPMLTLCCLPYKALA